MSTVESKTLSTAEYIPTLTERIIAHCDPLRIILFGSFARDEADPDSDIDLLVVLPQVEDRRKTAIEIRRQLAELTEWAVEARCPGTWPEATEFDARFAARQAQGVYRSVHAGLSRHGFEPTT